MMRGGAVNRGEEEQCTGERRSGVPRRGGATDGEELLYYLMEGDTQFARLTLLTVAARDFQPVNVSLVLEVDDYITPATNLHPVNHRLKGTYIYTLTDRHHLVPTLRY